MRRLFCVLLFLAACDAREVGKMCEETPDCREIPRGYCARAGICTATCESPGTACGPDGVCFEGNRTVCLSPCSANEDCGVGETCEVVRPTPTGLPSGACVITKPLVEP